MQFPCIQCGLCCKMLHKVPLLADYHTGDGVCRYLCDNLCEIYAQRPVICNVEKMYHEFFCNVMSEHEFIVENLKSCVSIAKEFEAVETVAKLSETLKAERIGR